MGPGSSAGELGIAAGVKISASLANPQVHGNHDTWAKKDNLPHSRGRNTTVNETGVRRVRRFRGCLNHRDLQQTNDGSPANDGALLLAPFGHTRSLECSTVLKVPVGMVR